MASLRLFAEESIRLTNPLGINPHQRIQATLETASNDESDNVLMCTPLFVCWICAVDPLYKKTHKFQAVK